MRKLTKILIICLLAVVYYYSCISYFWHKECMEYRRKEQHKQESMPRQIRVIYDICKSSKLEPIMEKSGQDYWKAPFETERDKGGDCEDLSIWLLYQLKKLGYNAWPVIGIDDWAGHMWVRARIFDGVKNELYDIDMVARTIHKSWQEICFDTPYMTKLEDVWALQKRYEKGEIK